MRLDKTVSTVARYLSDEGGAFTANEDGVVGVCLPSSEDEVVAIVREASVNNTPINVSGAGTGITGARVPIYGGLVLSMEKMLEAKEAQGCSEICGIGLSGKVRFFLDEARGIASVAPGVSLHELAALLPNRMAYPPDPTEALASVGGTVATNASGARSFHYGPTRNWIVGLRVVLADGEVLAVRRGEYFADGQGFLDFASETGKKYHINIPGYEMPHVKNAAGLYTTPGMDLIDLFIGSEGTLGIFTETTLRLARREEPTMDLVFFRNNNDALDFVDSIRAMRSRGVLSVEYFDSHALELVGSQHPNIPRGADAAVLLEVSDGTDNHMDVLADIATTIEAHHVVEDWCAINSVNRRNMKEFRHSVPETVNTYLRQHDSYKLGTDFAVPPNRFPEMMEAYRAAGKKFAEASPREGIHTVTFGHIGDCHVHFNFITSSPEERKMAEEIYVELAQKAIALGGTISGEHGVGKKTVEIEGNRIPYLQMMLGQEGLSEIARVKASLDPNGILNPGNMVAPSSRDR